MTSRIPVLGVRHVGVPRSHAEPELRLGRGQGAIAPGEAAVATCRPYPLEKLLSALRPLMPALVPEEAAVLLTPHTSPARECVCGIYAYNEIGERFRDTYFCVYLGWGRVYHGRHYWRAQYAKPLALGKLGHPERYDPTGRRAAWIERLARRYDIPLLPLDRLYRYVEHFGRWPEVSRERSESSR